MADTPSRKTLSIKPGGSRDADPDRQRSGSRAHRVARATVRTRDESEGGDERRRGPRPEGEGRPFERRPYSSREGGEQRSGERRPYPPREGSDERRRGPRPEGEGRPFERRPYGSREGGEQRSGERRPYPPREGGDDRRRGPRPEGEGRPFERRPYGPREGDEQRSGERRPYPPREGGDERRLGPRPEGEGRPFERRPYGSREGGEQRAGERRPYTPRDGGDERRRGPRPEGEGRPFERRPYGSREGGEQRADERRPYTPRDGRDDPRRGPRPEGEGRPFERRPYGMREGGEQRAGERRPYTPRDGGDERRRGPRPEGEGRPFERRPYGSREGGEQGAGERRPYPSREGSGERRPYPREGRERQADSRRFDERPPRGEAGERPHAGRGPKMASAETYPVFAPCPQGLEQALADELTALGFENVSAGRAGCRFTANWTGMMRANLHSRLATRILVQVAQGPVSTEDDILALAHATPWERWFGAEQTLRVDTSAVRSPMHSLQYCNLRAKDGICDRLREREGARPSIDTVRPDARVHLFLDETTATLYLDTSGESLFKRGWRYDKGEAPLRENLAAGLLALSGWRGDTPLIDPFCGSGTILIEAAYIALRVPPGVSRPFAFERLRDHDDYLWRSLKDEARAAILPRLEIPLIGSDLDPHAIDAARQNAERARLTPDAIELELRDARDIRPPEGAPGWIVTNPPYGERLSADETELWTDWSQTLKAHFDGWHVDVITTDRDLPRHLRLNAQRRVPLYNGALECRLFDFEIVGGSYRQKL